MKSGIELIQEERARQISEEGWTPEHDAQHTSDELVIAAACNAVHDTDVEVLKVHPGPFGRGEPDYIDAWPWNKEWDKRAKHSPERRLVIAGALIAAELDRLRA